VDTEPPPWWALGLDAVGCDNLHEVFELDPDRVVAELEDTSKILICASPCVSPSAVPVSRMVSPMSNLDTYYTDMPTWLDSPVSMVGPMSNLDTHHTDVPTWLDSPVSMVDPMSNLDTYYTDMPTWLDSPVSMVDPMSNLDTHHTDVPTWLDSPVSMVDPMSNLDTYFTDMPTWLDSPVSMVDPMSNLDTYYTDMPTWLDSPVSMVGPMSNLGIHHANFNTWLSLLSPSSVLSSNADNESTRRLDFAHGSTLELGELITKDSSASTDFSQPGIHHKRKCPPEQYIEVGNRKKWLLSGERNDTTTCEDFIATRALPDESEHSLSSAMHHHHQRDSYYLGRQQSIFMSQRGNCPSSRKKSVRFQNLEFICAQEQIEEARHHLPQLDQRSIHFEKPNRTQSHHECVTRSTLNSDTPSLSSIVLSRSSSLLGHNSHKTTKEEVRYSSITSGVSAPSNLAKVTRTHLILKKGALSPKVAEDYTKYVTLEDLGSDSCKSRAKGKDISDIETYGTVEKRDKHHCSTTQEDIITKTISLPVRSISTRLTTHLSQAKRLFRPLSKGKRKKRSRKGLPMMFTSGLVDEAVMTSYDTGTEGNHISLDLAVKLGFRLPSATVDGSKFKLANGTIIKSLGKMSLDVQFASTNISKDECAPMFCIFNVFKKLAAPALMGMAFLRATGTLSKHPERLVPLPDRALCSLRVCAVGNVSNEIVCTINGKEVIARADTGSEIALMSDEFVRRRGFKREEEEIREIMFADESMGYTCGSTKVNMNVLQQGQFSGVATDTRLVKFHIYAGLEYDVLLDAFLVEDFDIFVEGACALLSRTLEALPVIATIIHLGRVEKALSRAKKAAKAWVGTVFHPSRKAKDGK
jgi:hypothetical protein